MSDSRSRDLRRIGQLERALADADDIAEAVTRERDELRRLLLAATNERDRARRALNQPVYQLLAELDKARRELEEVKTAHDNELQLALDARNEAWNEARGYKDQNRQLRADLEGARADLRGAEEYIEDLKRDRLEAQQKVIELAVGLEPESEVLREKSARIRAIEAIQKAEQGANQFVNDGRAYAFIAQAWAAIAMIPEKRSSD